MKSWILRNQPETLEVVVTQIETYTQAEDGGRQQTWSDGRGREKMPTMLPTPTGPRGPLPTPLGPMKVQNQNPTGLKDVCPITAGLHKMLIRPSEIAQPPRGLKKVCFGCGQEGHSCCDYPVENYAWSTALSAMAQVSGNSHLGWEVVAKVKGRCLRALIDTGCSRTLIWAQPGWQTMGQMMVQCTHGDIKPCQWMEEEVTIAGVTQRLRMGVVPNLVHEMLLGRDWKEMERIPKEGPIKKVEEGFNGDPMEALQIQ